MMGLFMRPSGDVKIASEEREGGAAVNKAVELLPKKVSFSSFGGAVKTREPKMEPFRKSDLEREGEGANNYICHREGCVIP